MKMQHTYGIFEAEADYLISMVHEHAPITEVLGSKCPVCPAEIAIEFAEDGSAFSISCKGKPLHFTTQQEIAVPPPWWRECVIAPTDSTWYWHRDYTIANSGQISMHLSGLGRDGKHWSGSFDCPTDHPDYSFWCWVLRHSEHPSELIGNDELASLRTRYANLATPALDVVRPD